jgi:hypothetical protein
LPSASAAAVGTSVPTIDSVAQPNERRNVVTAGW